VRPIAVRDVTDTPPDGWDDLVVAAPGGHVLQGRAWAAHRAGQGWRTRFVTFDDGRAALVLVQRRPVVGLTAYCPRGPVAAGDRPELVAERAAALASWLRAEGVSVLAVDPELDASEAYDRSLDASGFRVIDEIQAGRHRMVLDLPAGTTEAALLSGCAKATRQRIRAATAAGTVVEASTAEDDVAAFVDLLQQTADRKEFGIGSLGALAGWWHRVLGSGRGVLLVARNGGRVIGGLLLYRQGGHLATAYSGDDATVRDTIKGTMHLLRWTAITMALAEGAPVIDLGAVDVPGARRRPLPGEATYGLFEHKLSFGARWVESVAAHEIVLRPWRHGLARLAARLPRPGRRTTRGRTGPVPTPGAGDSPPASGPGAGAPGGSEPGAGGPGAGGAG
jgi:lipid II:glycine glycyltransferase (peptidoglycan interpeptide bridge formation enzyme)